METLQRWYSTAPTATTLLASGAAVICLYALVRRWRNRRAANAGPRTANFEKDRVYFYNFPSCRTIVSVSPFALKLETWMRLHGVPYTAVRRINIWSRKGQIPFVELNGEELNESNLIIARLGQHFRVRDQLTDEQKGYARGLEMMLENQTVISYFYYRYVDDVVKFIDTWEFCGPLLRRFLYITFPRGYRKKAHYHGIGRNTVPEMYAMGCEDLLALSRALGGKQFLFGDEPTTPDCYAFGHLAQLLYIPVDYPHKRFVRENCQNLCDYTDRMRDRLWPDWGELCAKHFKGDGPVD